MSHFGVLVITEPMDNGYEEAVEELLAPYNEDGEWFREGSRWDWWVIGGRWAGYLDPTYDPYKDEANYSPCEFCEATGVTTQAVADKYPAYEKHVGKPCIQCAVDWGGTPKPFPGRKLNFGLEEQPSDAGTPVADVLARGVKPTHAIVTPDGEWHESGHMVWFGVSVDDKEQDTWEQEWRGILEQYQDKVATIVDCHV